MSTTTRRSSIVKQLAQRMKQISLQNGYNTDLGNQVSPRLKFWDQIDQYPSVHIASGQQIIQYQGGGFKDRYLNVLIRCYVNDDNSVQTLQRLLEDIQRIIDNNGRLAYLDSSGNPGTTRDIIIVSIDTDQGALAPLGAGQVILQVKY